MRIRLVHWLGLLAAFVVVLPMLITTLYSPVSSAHSLQGGSTPDLSGSSGSDSVEIPESWECETEPKSLISILGIMNDVEMAQYSDRVGTIWSGDVFQGNPLSIEDTAGIAWTLRQLPACANGLDPLRVMPLLSDELIAALIANVGNADDLSGALDSLPLLASDTLDQGGLPVLTMVDGWYDQRSTKRVWAVVEMPVTSDEIDEMPQFLVSFVYDKYYWVVDSVWTIE